MGDNSILPVFGKVKKLVCKSLPIALLCLSAAVLSFSFVSCTDDDLEGMDVQKEMNGLNDASPVTLSFTLAATRSTLEDGYEDATSAENRIKSYKIFFFDSTDNTYIATFEPDKFTTTDNVLYSVSGTLSETFVDSLSTVYNKSFKIVAIGNWETYPEESDFTQGTTTIENLCKGEVGSANAQFDCLKITSAEELSNISIPVYGVHTYSDVSFIQGQTTVLKDTISVLKAMAKVEVVDSTIPTRNYYYPTIKSARIIYYNAKGYCAPTGVYSEENLDENGYSTALNLIGGANDTQIAGKDTLDMFYDEVNNKWVAYVPEYSNTGGVVKCHVEVMAQCVDEENDSYDYTEYLSNPYRMYFCEYNENGYTVSNSDYDLMRNHLYRFDVKFPKIYMLEGGNVSAVEWHCRKK